VATPLLYRPGLVRVTVTISALCVVVATMVSAGTPPLAAGNLTRYCLKRCQLPARTPAARAEMRHSIYLPQNSVRERPTPTASQQGMLCMRYEVGADFWRLVAG